MTKILLLIQCALIICYPINEAIKYKKKKDNKEIHKNEIISQVLWIGLGITILIRLLIR